MEYRQSRFLKHHGSFNYRKATAGHEDQDELFYKPHGARIALARKEQRVRPGVTAGTADQDHHPVSTNEAEAVF